MKKLALFLLILLILVVNSQNTSAVTVSNSSIKTVEFFIAQETTVVAANTNKAYTFNFYIPETSPQLRYGFIEIQGASGFVAITNINVDIDGAGIGTYATISAAGLETVKYTIRHPFSKSIATGNNGPYVLNVKASGDTISFTSAKLILTYEYDSGASTSELKTIRSFILQDTASRASGTGVSTLFSFQIPESGTINVRSAMLEVEGASANAADNVLSVGLNNTNFVNATLDSSGISQAFLHLYNATALYSINAAGTYYYNLTVKGTGAATSMWSARLLLTYEADKSATTKQRTISYFINTTTSSIASGVNMAHAFSVPLAENSISAKSVFIKVNGWATAVDTTGFLVSATSSTDLNTALDINVEGSEWTALYNATGLYANLTTGVNGPYTLNVKITGPAITLETAEIFVTYNYADSSSTQMKTVEYAGGVTDPNQKTANLPTFRSLFVIAPESSVVAKAAYIVTSATCLGTTTPHTITTFFETSGATAFTQANSGEFTYDYILVNATNGISAANLTTGLNGDFLFSRNDTVVDSTTSAKLKVTYFFQPP